MNPPPELELELELELEPPALAMYSDGARVIFGPLRAGSPAVGAPCDGPAPVGASAEPPPAEQPATARVSARAPTRDFSEKESIKIEPLRSERMSPPSNYR